MSDALERRRFIRGAAVAAFGAAGLAGCGRPLDESELAEIDAGEGHNLPAYWWDAPSSAAGQHSLMPLPYATDALVLNDPKDPKIKGISAQVVEWHHDRHHAGYVKALNKIETDLLAIGPEDANANYSLYTELKRRETFNASGMYLHEIYWLNMIANGSLPHDGMHVITKLVHDFGSFDAWRADFVGACSTANTGWAILAISPYDQKLHNYACSFHDLGGVWGSIPLIACDVWEHAYYHDYGPDRASYIESFLRLLNWRQVEDSFQSWENAGFWA